MADELAVAGWERAAGAGRWSRAGVDVQADAGRWSRQEESQGGSHQDTFIFYQLALPVVHYLSDFIKTII